jgi:hypothetical protein
MEIERPREGNTLTYKWLVGILLVLLATTSTTLVKVYTAKIDGLEQWQARRVVDEVIQKREVEALQASLRELTGRIEILSVDMKSLQDVITRASGRPTGVRMFDK